jgi:hypothetical protein
MCLRQQEGRPRGETPQKPSSCEPCRQLAYRALCDGNDAAWDLLIGHLWPLIMRRLYDVLPELTPAAAQALGYLALSRFRQLCEQRGDLATNFPPFPALLTLLNRCLRQIIESPH